MSQAVLSQNEIDSLLEAMDSGEIDEEIIDEEISVRVKPYDFRRPVRLSKEYISTITMVLEDFSKISVNLLSTKLRRQVSMNMVSIEQVSFDEFIHSVPRFTLLTTLTSLEKNGVQIIEISPQASMQMVETLCGYDDEHSDFSQTNKENFTDIELSILEEIVETLNYAFSSAWKDLEEIESQVESIETNPQLLQSMSPNEPVVLTTFRLKLDGQDSFLNVCLPYVFFEDMLDQLSFRNWFHEGKDAGESDHQKFAEVLQPVDVDLKVLLGESEMSIQNFMDMEVGDIVKLDNKTSKPLSMLVGGKPYFHVKPGTIKNQMAAEVLEFIEGESRYE
ncbi:MAG: flagellar motor switch protein FliM [Tetragenococcus halophilus]|nr:flagellar motor switch protein FliM [Tetragenococcus halophilus]